MKGIQIRKKKKKDKKSFIFIHTIVENPKKKFF